MRKIRHMMKSWTIMVSLAVALSSLTLWLIESWIKYPLFIIEIFTIIVLHVIVGDHNIRLTTTHFGLNKTYLSMMIDVLLIASPLNLLIINVLHIEGGIGELILALFCTSLFPGYALLNIFALTRYFSRLETAGLSFAVSYAFTGFLTLASLSISKDSRSLIVLAVFIGLGLISMFKRRRREEREDISPSGSFARNIDSLALLLIAALYALYFYFLYPGVALLPVDIAQHYGSSLVLWRTPELYRNFGYLLAHAHESAFISIADAPVTFLQTALITLNFMTPLAFYAMAKSYLNNVDTRLPAISTILYSMFAGFAWVYLAKLKLEGAEGFQLSLLSTVNDKAYNGALYMAQPFLWYVPLSVSFTILIIQFLLLRKLKIGKKSFLVLFSVLTVASCLTHVTEAVIFSLFLCFLAFFPRLKDIRVDDALLASIISFAFIDAIYATLQCPLGKTLDLPLTIPLLTTGILLAAYTYRRPTVQGKLTAFLSKLRARTKPPVKPLVKTAIYVMTYIYFLGLVTWIGGVASFHTWAVVDVGSLPWFIYPVFLGIIGILSVASLYYFLEDFEARKLLVPFLVLIVFSLLFGRILTFINVNFFFAGYWEKRFTTYFLLGCSILAPIAIIKIHDVFRRRLDSWLRIFAVAFLASVIVVCGMQSTFMVVEQWNLFTDPSSLPSQDELRALDALQKIYSQDPYAFALTLASSEKLLSLAAPPYQPRPTVNLYTAKNPEIPFFYFRAHNLSHPYLYMAKRDFQLMDDYSDSWLARHLLPSLPIVYRNDEATIYNISSVSFPQESSTVALIVPFDTSTDPREPWLYAYDILSLGKNNYTVAYDLDPTIFSHSTLILSIDPPPQNIVEESFQDDFSEKADWEPISGSWQYTNDGLEAGNPGEYQDAFILSTHSAENFTASLSLKLLGGDLSVANYVSLIYDWRDQSNFKYAGLMFEGNKNVYAYFSSYNNGETKNYPPWPGLRTDLKWQFGDSFNLTISVQGENATLYIDESPYISMKTISTGGKLGIRMTRFYQVLFTGLKANLFHSLKLRDVGEYLDYARAGGRLVVLNTNGCGYFADRMLTFDNQTTEAYKISGKDIRLPANLRMPVTSPKADNIESIAYYVSEENSTVYAAKEKIGSGQIVYVNVQPIVAAMELSEDKSGFYRILGELLSPAEIQMEPFTYSSPQLSSFRKAEMSGSVQVNASSVLFPLHMDFGEVQMTNDDNSVTTLFNVTQLQISNHGYVHVETSDLTLAEGTGFYSTLESQAKVVIMSESNLTSVSASSANENAAEFSSVKMITLESAIPITLYARQPTIQIQGMITFQELYSSGETYQKTRTQGQNLRVNGSSSLTLYLSDVYTWTSSLVVSGSFERTPALMPFDELSSLPQAAYWSTFLAPTFMIAVFIVERKLKKRRR